MNKFKWIGRFHYKNETFVWVGFNDTKGIDRDSKPIPGKIIATTRPDIYKKNISIKWGSYDFEVVDFPTDPYLTYYIRLNKYNRRMVKVSM